MRESKVLELLRTITGDAGLEFAPVYSKTISLNGEKKSDLDVVGKGVFDKPDPAKRKHRYYLRIDISGRKSWKTPKNSQILTVIMLNPSQKRDVPSCKRTFVDQTVSNVIRIAKRARIDGNDTDFTVVEVLNLFSYIDPDSSNAEIKKDNEINEKFIRAFIEKISNPILLAWGGKARKSDRVYAQEIESMLEGPGRSIYVYSFIGDKKTPSHPSQQSKYVREFLAKEKPELRDWRENCT